jgi:type I restriction enzyme S subunit
MGTNLKKVKFKDVVYFNPSVKLDKGEEFCFVPMEDVESLKSIFYTEKVKKFEGGSSSKFMNDDILFARITPCLQNRKITQIKIGKGLKGFGSTEFFVFRAKEKFLDQTFLNYYIRTNSFVESAINSMVGASGRQRADKGYISNLEILIPEIENQKIIGEILLQYDKLIENNTKRISILEQMAEQLYNEWFVRMRFPNYENTKFIKGVPEGWFYSKLAKQIKIFRGKSYSSKELRESSNLPMINLKNVNRNGGYRRDGLKFFEGKYSPDNRVFEGDIVMAVTDMTQNREIVGRVARVPDIGYSEFIISMDLIRLVPKTYPNLFIYSFFRFSGIGHHFKQYANGANVLHLNPKPILNQEVLFPVLELAQQFNEFVEPLLNEVDLIYKEIENLKKTRDLLLPRLISGKLKII